MGSTYQELQDVKWNGHIEELIKFQKDTGKLYPKPNDGWSSLYNWAKNQRRLYRNGKLKTERQKKLEKIKFPWQTENMTFEDRIGQLLDYQKENGTLHVSQVAYPKDSQKHKLSRWVNEMRRLYNENRLPLHRINRLNSIGFMWNMEDEQFAANLAKLKRFFKSHARIPSRRPMRIVSL